ncbi:lipopolysaccharide biosynthesis protein [Sphingomonas sp. YL-JM2C]
MSPPLRRAIRNAGWLLGGKGAGGLLSLVYLALAARGLGVAGFGVFATILAYGQLFSNIATFQSWQAIVHYGAKHLAAGQAGRVRRLIRFTAALDIAAATLGTGFAISGIRLFGASFGWNAGEIGLGSWFLLSLLLGQRGTATGILRLTDRFGHAAAAELAQPALRLCGAATAFASGGGVGAFLLAWAVADLGCTLSLWFAAGRSLGAACPAADVGRPERGRVIGDNPGIVRFMAATNVSASIGLVWQQAPILAVSWFAGPSGAGIYRLAAQLGTALVKPVSTLARAVYPEFARAVAQGSPSALVAMIRQMTALTGLFAAVAVALAATGGRMLLGAVGGPDYAPAYPAFLLLTVASAINLAGFGLEPALVAAGRPWTAFAARGGASAIYLFLMLLCGPIGVQGVAWATIGATIASVAFLRISFVRAIAAPSVRRHCYGPCNCLRGSTMS